MRLNSIPQRGMALVMAMIVIVLITLLVAGAITFTGTERAAAMIQSDEDSMSACTQAARNLFLARLRVLLGNAQRITFADTLTSDGRTIYTGHFGDPANVTASLKSAVPVPISAIGEGRETVSSATNVVVTSAMEAHYYRVTAVCQERSTDGAQREIEFVVRVGL
jgi:Tfp pilus assembly protein PilX